MTASQPELEHLARRVEALEALVAELLLRIPAEPPSSAQPAQPDPRRSSVRPRQASSGSRWEAGALVVRVGDRALGLPVERVREVVRNAALQELPGRTQTSAFEGLLQLGPEPILVVDLRAALGLPALEDDLDCRLVVLDVGQPATAFKVDAVLQVAAVPPASRSPAPELRELDYLEGLVRLEGPAGLVPLLDPVALLEILLREGELVLDGLPEPGAIS